MKPDYRKIRQLEYELGFEQRPGYAAIELLKELHMSPGFEAAAAMEIQRAVEDNPGATRFEVALA